MATENRGNRMYSEFLPNDLFTFIEINTKDQFLLKVTPTSQYKTLSRQTFRRLQIFGPSVLYSATCSFGQVSVKLAGINTESDEEKRFQDNET
jgi:hypothetical protein